jgi:hypothetical protein
MKKLIFFAIIFPFILTCTKEVVIDIPPPEEQLVVEGHIENGIPPYVILTRNSAFYDTFSLEDVNEYFVHNALVTVSDGLNTATMQEFTIDTLGISVSAYVALDMVGEEGKTYTLSIQAENKTLSAVTTIPPNVPLDSIWIEYNADPENDSLVRLICRYSDPPQLGQYVRYFTSVNNESFLPGYNSVFEDALINGETFDFPLDRGVNRSDSNVFENYGLFMIGDTITVKWCNIDRAHFDFWRTLEFELNGQGSPFATPTRVIDNVEGGLGIWGGYSSSTISTIVQ